MQDVANFLANYNYSVKKYMYIAMDKTYIVILLLWTVEYSQSQPVTPRDGKYIQTFMLYYSDSL